MLLALVLVSHDLAGKRGRAVAELELLLGVAEVHGRLLSVGWVSESDARVESEGTVG